LTEARHDQRQDQQTDWVIFLNRLDKDMHTQYIR